MKKKTSVLSPAWDPCSWAGWSPPGGARRLCRWEWRTHPRLHNLGYNDFDIFCESEKFRPFDGCKITKITKPIFSFFEPFRPRLASKFAKSANVTPKSLFTIIPFGYENTQNLMLISNPLKSWGESYWKKVIGLKTFARSIKKFKKQNSFTCILIT